MPSSASGMGPRERDHRVDIVLGDNHGEACNSLLVASVEHWLRGQGLRVQRNLPYAGGFTTQRYGGRASAATPCRSKSTARSTWTRAVTKSYRPGMRSSC